MSMYENDSSIKESGAKTLDNDIDPHGMESSFHRLDSNVTAITDRINILEKKLHPVLRPCSTNEEKYTGETNSELSPAVIELSLINIRLLQQISRLIEINDRLNF